MSRYICMVCHGICDPGELTGGVCQECREEECQRQIRAVSVAKMLNGPYEQLELGLEVAANGY